MASCVDQDFPAVIIDSGSAVMKAGFATDDSPRVLFPTVAGRRLFSIGMVGMGEKDCYIGHEALTLRKQKALTLSYPIDNGIVTNWDDVERIWMDIYSRELKVDPEDHPLLLTESPLSTKYNRERSIQIGFETFDAPAVFLSQQAALSLYRSGSKTGVVLDSGEGMTHVVPVYEGHALLHAVESLNLAGGSISSILSRTLSEKGYEFIDLQLMEIINDIKKKMYSVSLNFEQESRDKSSSFERAFQLPDGQTIMIGTERIRTPEILFQPKINGLDDVGIHEKLYSSVMKCNIDIHNELFSNICLSVGTTMFPGFADRLRKEVTDLIPSSTNILNVFAPPERDLSAWIGGSIFASHSSFQKMCITRMMMRQDRAWFADFAFER